MIDKSIEQCKNMAWYTKNEDLWVTVLNGEDFIEMITERLVQSGYATRVEGVQFNIHDGKISASAYFFRKSSKE